VWKVLTPRGREEFVRHVIPAVLRPARILWNEVIGFLFLCLAVLFGSGAVRAWMAMDSEPQANSGHFLRFLGTTFLTLLMLYFGVTSFLRARRISRS